MVISGFHHVNIKSKCRSYLGFQWEEKYYVFTVLPFGLSTAPYVFTKIIRVLVRKWRSELISLINYLDDFLFSENSMISAEKLRQYIWNDLTRFGFTIALEKSSKKPVQRLEFLGY